jgi:5-methylcytosine-specific restriction protein B
VRVKWDTSFAKEIEPVKRWALVTVAPVGAELYQLIRDQGGIPPLPPPVDPLFPEMGRALERKGQAILYGPPGTGKTYQARRFAVWWLLQQPGDATAADALATPQALEAAERRLTTVQVARRVWWVVANPKEWTWDQLFTDKRVSYRYGRLARNYPLIQPGDLVVGYQSTPDKRVVALARVSQGLHDSAEGEPRIELEPLRRVPYGPTYSELQADPALRDSEPMRFRCQGTLFALTADEAEYLFALLSERDPELGAYTTGRESIGQLTWVTFHASYSYEDWIEGFRPVDRGSGGLILRLEDGLFKRICREAQAHPNRRYLLVVDEINRANVTKVLGELITLLEKDKRGMMITLPQSKESFTIPPNIYILGTMNTADRSIRLLDTALRRRFAFVELMPNLELLRGATVDGLDLDDLLEALNRRIAAQEGREKQIGHAFLLEPDGQPISDPEEFACRFRQEILPLLQEYCYDDYGALAGYLGAQLVNVEAQTLNIVVLNDPEKLIEALGEVVNPSGSGA